MSLKTKLAIGVSVLFVVFMTAIAWAAFSFFQKEFVQSVSRQQYALVAGMAEGIDGKLGMAQRALVAASLRVPPAALSNPDTAQRYLDERVTLQSLFNNVVFLLDPQGRLIAESPFIPGRRGKDLSSRQYYATVIATGKPYVSNVFTSTHSPGHPAIAMATPIFDGKGNLVAVMGGGVDLSTSNVLSEVSDTRIGKGGYLYLCDPVGIMVAHPDRSRVLGKLPPRGVNRMLDRAMDGFEGSGITLNSSGKEMIASFKRLKTNGWLLAANFPTAEAFEPLERARTYFITVFVLGTAAVLGLTWLLMMRLTLPLREITRHVTELPAKSGAERLIAYSSRDEIGTLAGAFNEMVTTVERQQEALAASMETARSEKARAEGVIAALGEGLAIIDRDFRVTYQNGVHASLFGNCIGRACYRCMVERDSVCPDCPVPLCFSDGNVRSLEKTIAIGGRDACLEITISPMRDASGEVVGGVELVRDITERHRVEQEILALNSALEERARMLAEINAELETFNYSLSHDLRTPLTIISASADRLLEDYAPQLDENGAYFAAGIVRAVERMDEILDAMLLLSRISRVELEREEVRLGSLALEILAGLRMNDSGRKVAAVIDTSLVACGDRKLLMRALENLLGNAWKYTAEREETRIEFGAVDSAAGKTFFVRDNGAGFDPRESALLFRPFARLSGSENFSGSGIGLAIVQRIIARHGGSVWGESEPGKGTTFFFTLPDPPP